MPKSSSYVLLLEFGDGRRYSFHRFWLGVGFSIVEIPPV